MEYYQPTPDSLGAENNVGHLLKLAAGSVVRMADQAVAPLGLTAIQWRPLIILRYTEINTPAELARVVTVDTGAMTRTLDRLEAKGFLTRQRCQEDRRVVLLELTPLGHDVVAKILPVQTEQLTPRDLLPMPDGPTGPDGEGAEPLPYVELPPPAEGMTILPEAEGGTNDDAHGHVDHIALDGEGFEFTEQAHVSLPEFWF